MPDNIPCSCLSTVTADAHLVGPHMLVTILCHLSKQPAAELLVKHLIKCSGKHFAFWVLLSHIISALARRLKQQGGRLLPSLCTLMWNSNAMLLIHYMARLQNLSVFGKSCLPRVWQISSSVCFKDFCCSKGHAKGQAQAYMSHSQGCPFPAAIATTCLKECLQVHTTKQHVFRHDNDKTI